MNLLYFSHSYRSEDSGVVEHFVKLMQSENLIPSLDPPGLSLNAARLERQLESRDGMIAILTWRQGSISEYILFEITLCLKARKPLLVFIEDILPDHLLPPRVLQRRFSRRFLLRQIREHQHALQILKSYLGESPQPKYQPSISKRSCLLVGDSSLPEGTRNAVFSTIDEHNYSPLNLDFVEPPLFHDQPVYEAIVSSELAVCFVDCSLPQSQLVIGAVRLARIPMITLSTDPSYSFHPHIPKEFQPRLTNPDDKTSIAHILNTEIETYEQDFIDLSTEQDANLYSALLQHVLPRSGLYEPATRNVFIQAIQEVTMRDKYTAGQVGAQGPQAHAHHMVFNQIWSQAESQIDLKTLVTELATLRATLKGEAKSPEDDIAIGSIAAAERSAMEGNGPKALEYLKQAGTWALDIAQKIGIPVAVTALQHALGP